MAVWGGHESRNDGYDDEWHGQRVDGDDAASGSIAAACFGPVSHQEVFPANNPKL